MNSMHVGQEGMTMMRYLGANEGTQQWYGLDNRVYVFGKSRPVGLIDSRDVDYFLKQYWDKVLKRPLFEVVQDSQSAELVVSKDEAVTVNPPAESSAMGESGDLDTEQLDLGELPSSDETAVTPDESGNVVDDKPLPDPTSMSVKALQAFLKESNLSAKLLDAMLEKEKHSEKPRTKAMQALRSAINKAAA